MQIQPILRTQCYRCHGGKHEEGGLKLDIRRAALDTADSGQPIVVPHQPDASLLLQRLTDPMIGDIMPLDGQPLSAAEIKLLRSWIAGGAEWPDEVAEGEHWAYRPLRQPAVPDADSHVPAIDQFLRRKLAKHGLTAAPLAEPVSHWPAICRRPPG